MVDIEKIQTNLVICLLNQIGSSSFYFNVFGLESFVELFFVQFHLLTFDFYIKFSPHSFDCYFYFFSYHLLEWNCFSISSLVV